MKFCKGFTLLEALVTVTIAGILLAAGVPAMRSTLQNNRSYMAAKEFVTMAQYARYEAIKRGVPVSLCAADPNNFGLCVEDGNYLIDESWSNGWLIFIDATSSGQVAAAGDVLKIRPGLSTTALVQSTARRITYDRDGFPTAGTVDFTFQAPGCVGQNGRIVSITPSGRTSVALSNCS
ncbi:MAG: GspH/FimT family pseudopilin [Legionellales bacterium]|nr:GspH/FimT family pseudopilin [Legionellales bacterium]